MQQHEREMTVGAFLDIQHKTWVEWVQRTGDDAIPAELHEHVVTIITDMADPDGGQMYLQTIALLSDDNLRWLVQQASGKDPLAA